MLGAAAEMAGVTPAIRQEQQNSAQWRRVHRQPGRDEIGADWSLLERWSEDSMNGGARHTVADNQRDSHVCQARSGSDEAETASAGLDLLAAIQQPA